MRDVNRIDGMCARLAEAWKQLPDWRLAQLLCNVQRALKSDGFYMEDEDFMSVVEQYTAYYAEDTRYEGK